MSDNPTPGGVPPPQSGGGEQEAALGPEFAEEVAAQVRAHEAQERAQAQSQGPPPDWGALYPGAGSPAWAGPPPGQRMGEQTGAAQPPLGPSLDAPAHTTAEQAELLFFGTLAPIGAMMTQGTQQWSVLLHVLTVEEENKVASYVARQVPEQRIMAEAMLRVAYSLLEVNGRPVGFGEPDAASELKARMVWIAQWPGVLLDAAVRAYAWASTQPVLRLQEMRQDPNTEAAPS